VGDKFWHVVDGFRAGSAGRKSFLLRALSKTFLVEFLSIGVLKLVADCAGFASPILLNLVVTFMEDKVPILENVPQFFPTRIFRTKFSNNILGQFFIAEPWTKFHPIMSCRRSLVVQSSTAMLLVVRSNPASFMQKLQTRIYLTVTNTILD
jgi:hypothetical protein